MVNRKSPPQELRQANLTPDQMRLGVSKLERRIAELEQFDIASVSGSDDTHLTAFRASIGDTLESVFGQGTTQYDRYKDALNLNLTSPVLYIARGGGGGPSPREVRDGVMKGIRRSIALLKEAVRSLNEQLGDLGESTSSRALRAYDGMDLHPEIARAASGLYRDGYYASAIENAVKALNAFVRMRSGLEIDGTSLMEKAFSPNAPILKFNNMNDQSDRDEQRGFMMMFSGAVSGLRNPRAHKLIQDDAERALEFIAFISLLAKLLDGAHI